ncbi:MAG: DNA mismatch repair protein MutS [Sphingomonadaceae bacterium]|nr:DNA mismatch repair protein MutS [Sphingomonadaceae bacterium]
MMAQYFALKAEAADCLLFYRMGDFFELFFDDARVAAQILDIALTTRGEHGGEKVPMCGVPVHAAEAYLARLIRAGQRVAIAQQVETPEQARARDGSKALVRRAIVRRVTAGTLTDEALLEPKSANWLFAIAEAGGAWGWAAVDVSTGAFETGGDEDELASVIARLQPAEILVAEGGTPPTPIDATRLHPRPRATFDSMRGEKRLAQLYGVATLDGFGRFSRAELAAAGAIILWLDNASAGELPWLQPPRQRASAGLLSIDAASRESLEITQSAGGTRAGSLLATIDCTKSGAGARQLAADLSAPLRDKAAILARHAAVGWALEQEGARHACRQILGEAPDVARALGRIIAARGTPRDLGALRDGLAAGEDMAARLGTNSALPPLLAEAASAMQGHGALIDELRRALVPAPPTESASGGYIAPGYDAALDVLRDTAAGGRRAIAALEAQYRETTGIASLKIRHNAVLGYHIEVTQRHADALMAASSPFTHRQTLAGVVRFNAPELAAEAASLVQAGAQAIAAESAHLSRLFELAARHADAIAASAAAMARIDVTLSHAEMAVSANWCRPEIADSPCLLIEGGRHPVVEAALAAKADQFVANDVTLLPDDRLWLVTGPNMGGKSTFLRQCALIILLAQAGSFVPARAARLGLVDRLFSRVGASDNLARGRSTFMVEMVETAAILTQATADSFIILDEVGRGTSTYDGLALAWAVAEAVHDKLGARCLFATHYHELTRLAERLDALSLHHVRAREWQGDLVLLHEVADGPAASSYGLAVARLAGLPKEVLARAKAVLSKLEAGRDASGGLAAGLDDLPLFSALLGQPEVPATAADPLRDALAAMDIDAMRPRDAIDALYHLRQIVEQAE